MASKTKAEFIVRTGIVLHGVQRGPGHKFTACADGVHVTRWHKQGKIGMVMPELTDAQIAGLLRASLRGRSEREFHTTADAALADGWVSPYVGTQNAAKEPRIYGQRKGNHRIFRCWRITR